MQGFVTGRVGASRLRFAAGRATGLAAGLALALLVRRTARVVSVGFRIRIGVVGRLASLARLRFAALPGVRVLGRVALVRILPAGGSTVVAILAILPLAILALFTRLALVARLTLIVRLAPLIAFVRFGVRRSRVVARLVGRAGRVGRRVIVGPRGREDNQLEIASSLDVGLWLIAARFGPVILGQRPIRNTISGGQAERTRLKVEFHNRLTDASRGVLEQHVVEHLSAAGNRPQANFPQSEVRINGANLDLLRAVFRHFHRADAGSQHGQFRREIWNHLNIVYHRQAALVAVNRSEADLICVVIRRPPIVAQAQDERAARGLAVRLHGQGRSDPFRVVSLGVVGPRQMRIEFDVGLADRLIGLGVNRDMRPFQRPNVAAPLLDRVVALRVAGKIVFHPLHNNGGRRQYVQLEGGGNRVARGNVIPQVLLQAALVDGVRRIHRQCDLPVQAVGDGLHDHHAIDRLAIGRGIDQSHRLVARSASHSRRDPLRLPVKHVPIAGLHFFDLDHRGFRQVGPRRGDPPRGL